MNTSEASFLCPVCGYVLDQEPWEDGIGSQEICCCCGIQFGYDDAAQGDPVRRVDVYSRWRSTWIEEGMEWRGSGAAPSAWDPLFQLRKIGVTLE